MQADGLTLQGLDRNDFSPEKVADRILSFIGQALGRSIEADPKADESKMLGQIKKGVEKAFKETRKMLKGLGIFKGEVKKQVEQTQQRVEKGLDRLKKTRQHEQANVPVMQFQGAAVDKSVNQSTALEIRTQEGDLVKIDFSQSYSSRSSAFELQAEGFYTSGFQNSSAMNSSLDIVVEGDLNEDEIKAIDGLMQKMNKVSHAFFKEICRQPSKRRNI